MKLMILALGILIGTLTFAQNNEDFAPVPNIVPGADSNVDPQAAMPDKTSNNITEGNVTIKGASPDPCPECTARMARAGGKLLSDPLNKSLSDKKRGRFTGKSSGQTGTPTTTTTGTEK